MSTTFSICESLALELKQVFDEATADAKKITLAPSARENRDMVLIAEKLETLAKELAVAEGNVEAQEKTLAEALKHKTRVEAYVAEFKNRMRSKL